MSKDTDYEKFTQEIYQKLLKVEGFENVEVKHNIKLTGRSGQKHQIDVYWEYSIAGVTNKVILECKNYNKTVSIGRVRDLYGLLADLNNVNGILVTKKGYQRGAKKYGEFYGINLKELRYPDDSDWKDRIKVITFETKIIVPNIKTRTPILDQAWAKENLIPDDTNKGKYTFGGMANEIKIFDATGNIITDFHQLESQLPIPEVNGTSLEHTFTFENGYIDVQPFGKIKINGVKYVYDINVGIDEFKIDAEDFVQAILKDAITGDVRFFHKNE